MKKLNIQVYQGDPSGLVTKDNNNLFIEGDVQYFTGAGTIVKSVTSIKNSNGDEIMSGGGGGDIDPDIVDYLEEHPEIKYDERCGLMGYYDFTEEWGEHMYMVMASDDIQDGIYLGFIDEPIDLMQMATYHFACQFKSGDTVLCKSTDGKTNKGMVTFTKSVTLSDFDGQYTENPVLIPASSFTFSFTFDPVV